MWRRNQPSSHHNIIYCLALALLAVIGADARIQYTEGGSFDQSSSQAAPLPASASDAGEYDIVELVNSGSANAQSQQDEESERLAGIVEQLQRIRAAAASSSSDGDEPIPSSSSSSDSELEELQKFGAQIRELAEEEQDAPVTEEEEEIIEVVEKPKPNKEKPLTAQKKGQSEFVEFVEPVHVAKLASKQLKNRETLEKRVADYRLSRHEQSGVELLYSSSNMLFIAFVTMCCVLSVVGVVGGAYYYKHVRSINEDPFDDFTRYSPAGPPGRDKKMKNNFACEKGDETLAYKAQLHHYQQTKQKIIGDGHAGALEDDTSDKSDDEADLEHNFSVYECPGLAPTGDIEVQNPNFVDSAASSPTREQ